MKRLRSALSAFTVIAALAVGGAVLVSPASARSNLSFDVTSLSAPNVVVKNDRCFYHPVTMAHRQSGADSWSVDTYISRGRYDVTNAYFSKSYREKRDSVLLCPSGDELGQYKIGPSLVSADTYLGDSYDEIKRTDYTYGTFYIRAHARTQIAAKRSGKNVEVTARAQRYAPNSYSGDGYTPYNPKAKIQYKSGRTWKTVATVQLRKGVAKKTMKASSKRIYRVTFGQVSWATGATSGTVKR